MQKILNQSFLSEIKIIKQKRQFHYRFSIQFQISIENEDMKWIFAIPFNGTVLPILSISTKYYWNKFQIEIYYFIAALRFVVVVISFHWKLLYFASCLCVRMSSTNPWILYNRNKYSKWLKHMVVKYKMKCNCLFEQEKHQNATKMKEEWEKKINKYDLDV